MKSILSSKISPLINYSPFANLNLKPDRNFLFPYWLKIPFVFFLTLMFLRAFFFPWLADLFNFSSPNIYTNFFHIYQYVLFFIILTIIFYLNFFVNKTNYTLKVFSPLIAYVLIKVTSDFIVFFLPIHLNFSWFFDPPTDQAEYVTDSRLLFKDLFLDPIFTFSAVILFFSFEKTQFKRIYSLFRNRPLTVFFFILIVILVMFIRARPDYLTSTEKISDNEGYIRFYLKHTTKFGKIFYVFSLILIFPFWEELIFRFALQKIFATQKSQGFLAFIIFSSFMFAMPHISPNEVGSPRSFFDFFYQLFYGTGTNFTYWYMAYILALVYVFSGYNLFFVITIHVINNGIVTL